jgi:hypothetical protein
VRKTRPQVVCVILGSKHKHDNRVNIPCCGGTNDVEAIKPVITSLPVRINGIKVVKTSPAFRHAKHLKVLHPLPANSTSPLWVSENPYSIHSLLSSVPTDTVFV